MIRMWNDKLHTNVLLQSAVIDNNNYVEGGSDGDEIKEEKQNEKIYSNYSIRKECDTYLYGFTPNIHIHNYDLVWYNFYNPRFFV